MMAEKFTLKTIVNDVMAEVILGAFVARRCHVIVYELIQSARSEARKSSRIRVWRTQ